jgi:hypothetical protein
LGAIKPVATASADAVAKGRTFLVSLLDANLDLLPEYRGAKVYWLFHDNYLAAKVLDRTHPATARRILAAMRREGIRESGKIELLFGEARKPLPFRHYQLRDVRPVGDKLIRTEVATEEVMAGWEQYADLLLLAAIAESRPATAQQHWETALRLWDGRGFNDPATRQSRRYATYKLALALVAANRLSPPATLPQGLLERLLTMQSETGGWITDYSAKGEKIGLANVETTCLAILGLEARAAPSPKANDR